jgi:hypothetical protein
MGVPMTNDVWLSLTDRDQDLLRRALASYVATDAAGVESLMAKLQTTEKYPAITIGVYGGLVQWVMGNPFPIRLCDYDGEKQDLPDVDERGQRCTIGYASPDI